MKINKITGRLMNVLAIVVSNQILSAQSNSSGSNLLIITLVGIGIFLLFGAIFTLSDQLLQVEAVKSGVDTEKRNYSIFPGMRDIFGKALPSYTEGSYVHNFSKGHDIKLLGKAELVIDRDIQVSTFAVKPPNFRGLSPIPRVVVNQGDEVLAGDVLFHDKKDDRIKYVSPVSGEVIEIRRGQKRAITEVVVLADKDIRYKQFEVVDIEKSGRQEIVNAMLNSGLWSLISERPYDLVANPDVVPVNIFISTFDTAPLAPDANFIIKENPSSFQKGLDVLSKLTSGSVHLGLSANQEDPPHSAFSEATNVKLHWFRGPHPSGNVGIHIHHIAPIGRTNKVWTLGIQDVVAIGQFFEKGVYNSERIIALTGSEVKNPRYVKTHIGANIGDLVNDELNSDKVRIISGDVLSGQKVEVIGFMNVREDQVTVIKEGDYYELFGWILALNPRPSVSRSFPNFLLSNFRFEGDTNTHGEKRAFVVTGQYEALLPMNIYVQQLMKAIMTGDFEKMEGLGINELIEEDVALCEFACTSKMPLQEILRDGIDMMREQS